MNEILIINIEIFHSQIMFKKLKFCRINMEQKDEYF